MKQSDTSVGVELGLEFDRFYDLVRWGIAEQVLHAAGKLNYQPKNALLPIPQDEIDKSKGVLKQNPDYVELFNMSIGS